jgi:hypothetical protein
VTVPNDYAAYERLYQTHFSSTSLTAEGLRYLKVRSLIDSEPLTASPSLRQWLKVQARRFNRQAIAQLRVQMFNDASITSTDLDAQLRATYREIEATRGWNVRKLVRSLRQISRTGDEHWQAWSSVYRDDIRAHIQHRFVRTPDIQDYAELLRRIDQELDPMVKGYTVISWYNQWTSALIERIIFSHPHVVPATRRIDKVGFFFLNVPIDLKVTFLPQGYLAHLRRQAQIRDPAAAIAHTKSQPVALAQWLYENQGEARFSDSHRLFIVLINEHDLEQSWKLKSEFSRIEKIVNAYLSKTQQLNAVTWSFQGQRVSGTFTTYTDVLVIRFLLSSGNPACVWSRRRTARSSSRRAE